MRSIQSYKAYCDDIAFWLYFMINYAADEPAFAAHSLMRLNAVLSEMEAFYHG